ncbi:ACT domain-containing protein [Kitasatospora aureofaciens]|nr:ACT domain-containing protein [Kitasatospora aureofaciens]QEV01857.1 ACT domain-containing protein [Streptomyces viridifaciens]ARF80609.1 acetyltransferase [Kitasatospora aureofaciens]OEV33505.1 acetyltransferase [Kitasatospora aureofaciens]UKZ08314.1 ACT domain-containing protein [Streptomyces viridifaciens]HJD85788.1 ACT domain-containing protein [Kitasatospora aureofaciens]
MAGERDLATLLRGMRPQLNPGRYVYCTLPAKVPAGMRPVVTVAEPEGVTMVVTQEEADALGLRYEYVAAWITLQIHSALEAVGLTAAVAGRLAEEGISCNVVAGFHHDHLFVAADDAERAVRALEELSARSA